MGTLLLYAGLGLALMVLLMNAVVMLTRYRQYRFSTGLIAGMSTRLLRHYLSQPYAFTLTRNTGDLTNLVVREVERVTQGANAGLGLIRNAVTIPALLVFLVLLDPLLALVSFLVLGIPDDEIDDDTVLLACRQAQVSDFIEVERASGYATIVRERGVRLWRGQRQRIGIARGHAPSARSARLRRGHQRARCAHRETHVRRSRNHRP